MNKLAYDLALLCVEHGLRYTDPNTCQESALFALSTFKETYNAIMESGEPILDFFSSSG